MCDKLITLPHDFSAARQEGSLIDFAIARAHKITVECSVVRQSGGVLCPIVVTAGGQAGFTDKQR